MTAAAKHFASLLDRPCIVTGCYGVTRHHICGGSAAERLGVRGSRKHSDWLSLPIISTLHQGSEGIHTIGVIKWEQRFCRQADLIDKLGAQLGLDLWALAAQEAAYERANRRSKPIVKRSRVYSPPTKQIPRN